MYLVPFYARNKFYMEIYDIAVFLGVVWVILPVLKECQHPSFSKVSLPFSHEEQIHLPAAPALFLLVRV